MLSAIHTPPDVDGQLEQGRTACAPATLPATWLRDEEATASVPVACPMARSEAVCSGHSRTRRVAPELRILWSTKHDKPVPKLTVSAAECRRQTQDQLPGVRLAASSSC